MRDDVCRVVLVADVGDDEAHAAVSERRERFGQGAGRVHDERLRDARTELAVSQREVFHDLGDVALEVFVGKQAAREVRVRRAVGRPRARHAPRPRPCRGSRRGR